MSITRTAALALDAADPFAAKRALFTLPEGVIYLDGNSLGPLPKSVAARVARAVTHEWGETLIKSWNEHGWFHLPRTIGNRIARLIGAPDESVIAGDTISVNLFKVLSAALKLRPNRRVILSDSGNFPSDLYVAQGLRDLMEDGHELRVVAPEDVAANLGDDVAVMMVTEVDYRTARRHDMAGLTAKAHAAGALALWDLAHSAGAVPVDLAAAKADFAVGCTYKYLNGGPGAPAFVYVAPDLQDLADVALAGWWSHAAPFAFDLDYRPAPGIVRMQCGTQPMLSMIALGEALTPFDGVDMRALFAKGQSLCRLFAETVEEGGARHGLILAGPRDFSGRGSHVSFHCPEGYAVMQALIARGVIGDFRAPDMIRFGFAPLYNSHAEAYDAARILLGILDTRAWDTPEFLARKAVT